MSAELPDTSSPQWSPAFTALDRHCDEVGTIHLCDLFCDDPDRGARLVAEAAGLRLDYSKNRVTDETMRLLFAWAAERDVERQRDDMFNGARVNVSEDRPALHVALRMPRDAHLVVEGVDVVARVHHALDQMAHFVDQVRSGQWRGFDGRPIRNIVNIGIGGSDLGPVMVYEALTHYSRRDLTFRFVANVDSTDLVEALRDLDPGETLFIVASKTFGTLETLTNAHSARQWIVDALGSDAAVAHHVVAVSSNAEKVADFGIDPANMFELWDWVGGRYSIDSAIGLSIMMAIGPDQFSELLAGFHDMDEHFRHAPTQSNLPMLLGLLAVWNRNFLDLPTVAVIPYDQYLSRLPSYLQQLTMESNGKHVTDGGDLVAFETGAIYWGDSGTNGQHSFFQLLHQGTTVVPVDFIGFARSLNPLGAHHDILCANLFAQARALAFGSSASELREKGVPESEIAHRVMEGNRPSNVIMAEVLTPRLLGSLVALYEHSVFVQGALWGIDSFDQWGVELGKALELEIYPALSQTEGSGPDFDSSTNSLISWYRSHKNREVQGDHD